MACLQVALVILAVVHMRRRSGREMLSSGRLIMSIAAIVALTSVLSVFAVALVPGRDWAAFPLFITIIVVIYCVAAATSKTFRTQCD